MECALLFACALRAADPGPPWGPAGLGRLAKAGATTEGRAAQPGPGRRPTRRAAHTRALQLCCLCCASVAVALASDSSSGGSGLNDDYVFVTPVEVDSGGSYISHDILHNRRRRSAHGASSSLHYRFSAFGQDLHLELKPSAILSSHFTVQVLGKDGASETREPEAQQCLYQGFIRNDSSSSVAVSTCAGLILSIENHSIGLVILLQKTRALGLRPRILSH
ncbi:hypothetical protein U0070_018858 [Myodes glareolus]|uniref:Peptidase M12B propeptide domain-containing protein n=1 Tax=Myodes glareolus TaxID=447135 RepID=A0AAW0JVC5_MYOGA